MPRSVAMRSDTLPTRSNIPSDRGSSSPRPTSRSSFGLSESLGGVRRSVSNSSPAYPPTARVCRARKHEPFFMVYLQLQLSSVVTPTPHQPIRRRHFYSLAPRSPSVPLTASELVVDPGREVVDVSAWRRLPEKRPG